MLIGEDGVLEVVKFSFSVELFVLVDNKLFIWVDVKSW